jgi:LemA protein
VAEPGDAGVELRREGYSDEEVRRILDRAGRLQQRVERGTSPGILRESAAEVGLRREYVDQAMAELAAERAQRDRIRRVLPVVAVVVAVLLALFLIGSYNALRTRLIAVQEARAQLENVLQRRYDLIPNLIAVTREYAGQERQLFETLAQARQRFAAAGTLEEKEAVERDLRQALDRLNVVVEDNPEIQSSVVYARLQDELAGAENRIAVERRRYNQAVAEYNRAAGSFPLGLARVLLGFPARMPFFEAEERARQAPRVWLPPTPLGNALAVDVAEPGDAGGSRRLQGDTGPVSPRRNLGQHFVRAPGGVCRQVAGVDDALRCGVAGIEADRRAVGAGMPLGVVAKRQAEPHPRVHAHCVWPGGAPMDARAGRGGNPQGVAAIHRHPFGRALPVGQVLPVNVPGGRNLGDIVWLG